MKIISVKRWLVTLSPLLLSGCFPSGYSQAGVSQQQEAYDEVQCKAAANQLGMHEYSTSFVVEMNYSDFVTKCMAARGYTSY